MEHRPCRGSFWASRCSPSHRDLDEKSRHLERGEVSRFLSRPSLPVVRTHRDRVVISFVLCFIRSEWWPYLFDLPFFLIGMAIIAPGRANLARQQRRGPFLLEVVPKPGHLAHRRLVALCLHRRASRRDRSVDRASPAWQLRPSMDPWLSWLLWRIAVAGSVFTLPMAGRWVQRDWIVTLDQSMTQTTRNS
jgi:hypothetical protein